MSLFSQLLGRCVQVFVAPHTHIANTLARRFLLVLNGICVRPPGRVEVFNLRCIQAKTCKQRSQSDSVTLVCRHVQQNIFVLLWSGVDNEIVLAVISRP